MGGRVVSSGERDSTQALTGVWGCTKWWKDSGAKLGIWGVPTKQPVKLGFSLGTGDQ